MWKWTQLWKCESSVHATEGGTMPISFRDEKQNKEVGISTLTLTTPTLTSNVLKKFAQGK